ncbi:MAG: hypothetical protein IJX78_05500 [Bacilli bacterium]|nr:hypothetical protein [Bacilli bacterium]
MKFIRGGYSQLEVLTNGTDSQLIYVSTSDSVVRGIFFKILFCSFFFGGIFYVLRKFIKVSKKSKKGEYAET